MISTNIGFHFNTKNDLKDSRFELEAKNKLKVELKAGIWAKAEAVVAYVKSQGYFELSGEATGSITFGHGIYYKDEKNGIYYRPKLGFDGLDVHYVLYANIALLQNAAIKNENIFELLMDATKICSLGQITSGLFEVGGQYRRNM